MTTQTTLVLASGSPRRVELLTRVGLRFEARPVDCDESWRAGESPIDYARRVAGAKADAAVERARIRAHEGPTVVLAADTAVWLDEHDRPLGKPVDADDARRMLALLTRGAPHRVTTACVFARIDGDATARSEVIETTRVHMRELDEAALEAWLRPYLDGTEWTDKAASYAIQGRAAGLVTAIEGSYTTVVGLPLAQVVAHLETLGVRP